MSECKCNMSISILGDGCRYCQPQEYIDRLETILGEYQDEAETIESGTAEKCVEIMKQRILASDPIFQSIGAIYAHFDLGEPPNGDNK